MDPLDSARLFNEAGRAGLLPAALASRIIAEWLAKQDDQAPRGDDPVHELLQWLEPRIDAVRDQGEWPANVSITFFEAIENEALGLYHAAEQQLGRNTLNQVLARHIRVRLDARAIQRGGRVCVTRVRRGTTTLVKTVTLLQRPDARS